MSSAAASQTSSLPSGWTTFHSPIYAYQIDHPSGWRVDHDSPDFTLIEPERAAPGDQPGDRVTVILADQIAVREAADAMAAFYREQRGGECGEVLEVQVSGKNGLQVHCTDARGMEEQAMLLQGSESRVYIVSFTVPPHSPRRAELERIAGSIRFAF